MNTNVLLGNDDSALLFIELTLKFIFPHQKHQFQWEIKIVFHRN
jgi:hypothetical protein